MYKIIVVFRSWPRLWHLQATNCKRQVTSCQ